MKKKDHKIRTGAIALGGVIATAVINKVVDYFLDINLLSGFFKGLSGDFVAILNHRGETFLVPWWLVALFTLMCLVMMYGGFAWVLGEQRDTVLKPYQQLDPASGVSMDDVK